MLDESSKVYCQQESVYSTATGHWSVVETITPTNRLPAERLFPQPKLTSVVTTDISLAASSPSETLPTFNKPKSNILQLSYRDATAVATYLTRHPDLKDFIQRAGPMLIQSFGGPVEVVLEVLTYPDESAHQELVGWIQSTDTIEAGLEKLEQFEDSWFLDHMHQVGDRFNFNIETR